jgi:cytoskeletal protein CcmA (bactofilin family)
MAFKKKIKTTRIDTLVGRHSKIVGDIHYGGGLHIEGIVEGNIMAESEDKGVVIISELGTVEGEIRGPSIIINGTVHGNVYATGTIELAAGAKINGNVYYNLLEMTVGAEVNGNLVHQELSKASANTPTKITETG